jgi:thioredoxin 2
VYQSVIEASVVGGRFAAPARGENEEMNGRTGVSGRSRRGLLVFFSALRSGPARRMESLIAQLARKERHRLSVQSVDVEQQPELAQRFRVRKVPTLVLVKGRRTVARLEGRANAAEIEELVDEHLDGSAKSAPREKP